MIRHQANTAMDITASLIFMFPLATAMRNDSYESLTFTEKERKLRKTD